MANNEEKPYTFDDLAVAVSNYSHAKGVRNDWEGKRLSAQDAVDSHQKEVDKADTEVDRRKAEIKKILNHFER